MRVCDCALVKRSMFIIFMGFIWVFYGAGYCFLGFFLFSPFYAHILICLISGALFCVFTCNVIGRYASVPIWSV